MGYQHVHVDTPLVFPNLNVQTLKLRLGGTRGRGRREEGGGEKKYNNEGGWFCFTFFIHSPSSSSFSGLPSKKERGKTM